LSYNVYQNGVLLEDYKDAAVDIGQVGFWKVTLYRGLSGTVDIQVGGYWINNVDAETCAHEEAPAPVVECPYGLEWGAGIQTSPHYLVVNIGCDPLVQITINGVTTNYTLPMGKSYFHLNGTGTVTVSIEGRSESFTVNFGSGPLTATLQ
jgi:hypothetical protein